MAADDRPLNRALDPEATVGPARSSQPSSTSGDRFSIGTVIDGRFRITGAGVAGGMGVVYPVTHLELTEQQALKVLHPNLVADATAVERFREEARLTRRLQHPGIVRVWDFGDWQGRKYLQMEWVGGGSLRQQLERLQKEQGRRPRLPLREALGWIRQLAEALAYAHRERVLHRDLKPENVLLDGERLKLTDFGIAKLLGAAALTTTAARMGTAYYMAPEQLQGGVVDARADLYSLGVVLYELLCGEVPSGYFPFPHEIDPSLPEAIDPLLKRCLARLPDQRFSNVEEFQAAMGQLERGLAEAEAKRQAAVEAERRRVQEEAARKQREEEAARKAAQDAERRRQADEKAAAERKQHEAEERKVAEERKKKEAERQKLAEAEARRREQEARERAEPAEQERQRAEAAARRRRWKLGIPLVAVAPIVAIVLYFVYTTSQSSAPVLVPIPTAEPPRTTSRSPALAPAAVPQAETPRAATGKDGASMVLVPAGEFSMGSDEHGDERPRHRVHLDGFYIDRYETTNALYRRFMETTGHQAPGYWGNSHYNDARQPVVGVSWNDADAYCRWAGNRLPTEAEWEKAARGTDGRKYPWGEQWDSSRANAASELGRTAPVSSYPGGVSPYGAHDMAGNVWEWVADWYDKDYYKRSPERNPRGPDSGTYRVLRGGSWDSSPIRLRAANRDFVTPDDRNTGLGFRCARGSS